MKSRFLFFCLGAMVSFVSAAACSKPRRYLAPASSGAGQGCLSRDSRRRGFSVTFYPLYDQGKLRSFAPSAMIDANGEFHSGRIIRGRCAPPATMP